MIWYRLIVLLVYLISNCVAPDPQTSASQNSGSSTPQNAGSSNNAGGQNSGSSEEDLKPKITQAQKEEWQDEIDKLKVTLYIIYI